jgi:hypothetical protein
LATGAQCKGSVSPEHAVEKQEFEQAGVETYGNGFTDRASNSTETVRVP